MQRLLLVEDDMRLAVLVKEYLEANHFNVAIEDNGLLAKKRQREFSPDIIVLDVMLPGKDGLTICREIRDEFSGPILMLTARNEDADQILGLEFGADDYVVKPVEPRVLLARIKALLRRSSSQQQREKQQLEFGCLSINDSSRTVMLNASKVSLSSLDFDLLLLLANRAGEVVSREFLFQEIYGRPYDGLDRAIDVRISQLRKRLLDNIDNPQRIKTVWGRGYLFVPDAWEV